MKFDTVTLDGDLKWMIISDLPKPGVSITDFKRKEISKEIFSPSELRAMLVEATAQGLVPLIHHINQQLE